MGFEESEEFRSGSISNSHISQTEPETPSETSIFLPDEGRKNSFNRSLRAKSCSNKNLGILVISASAEIGRGTELDIAAGLPRVSTIKSLKGFGDEEAQKLDKSSEQSDAQNEGFLENYAGILLALLAGLVFAVGGVIVKYLKIYHPFTLAIFRFQGILLPGFAMVFYAYYVQKIPIFEPVWPLTQKKKALRVAGLLCRCVFGTIALVFHFYSLQKLDVADALVISSCQPVFVTFAAYLFLRESCGVVSVFTAVLSMVGVGVLSRPPILTGHESFDLDALIGAGYSLASMITATMVFIIIRYLKDVHVSLLTLVLGVIGSVQSAICSYVIGDFKVPDTWEHFLLALALAGVTLLGQVAMTLALQLEQAGSIAVVRSCDCIFAFLLQFVFFSTIPDVFSVTGTAIIISCVMITAFRKWISSLPADHPSRLRFRFVIA